MCGFKDIFFIFTKFKCQIDFGWQMRTCFISLYVCLSVFLWLYVSLQYVCLRVNPQRHKAPVPLPLPAAPPLLVSGWEGLGD